MTNNSYDILDYLSKFLDENVSVYTDDMLYVYNGTCTAVEPLQLDSDIICITVTADESHQKYDIYHITSYDYKLQKFFDGNSQKFLNIKLI